MRIQRRITEATGSELTVAQIIMGNKDVVPTGEVSLETDLVFFVKTYAKLSRGAGVESWDAFFDLTNKFLASVDISVQEKLYIFYENAKKAVRGVEEKNYDRVINAVADELYRLVKQTDLPTLLLAFIEQQNLLFPDLTGIGERDHDRKELTFRLPEYRVLTAISLSCKLMCPIWGDFIFRTQDYIKTSDKEAHCLAMFMAVLESPAFTAVHHKLEGYMHNSIASTMKRFGSSRGGEGYDLSFTLAHSGFGEDRFAQQVYGMLCVKKLALYDPIPEIQPGNKVVARNIMKYVAASIRATITTTVMLLQRASSTMVRRDPRDAATDSDSTTILENESHVSKVTADVPIVVIFGVMHTVQRLIERNRFSKQLFEEAMVYYRRHPPQLNIFTRTLVSTFISRELGGATALKYLTSEPMAQLITLAQFYMAANGMSNQLIHLLSSLTPATKRTEMSSTVDQRIRMTFETSVDYRKLLAIYPLALGQYRSIKQQVMENVIFLTEYDHFYNTAPAIQTLIEDDPVLSPGDVIRYDDLIVQNVCRFIAQYGQLAIDTTEPAL